MPAGNLSPIAESRPSLSFSLVPPPTEATLQQNEQRQKIRDPLVTASNRTFEEAPEISEDDIRKSLIVEAKRRKYWGTKAITKMLFEEIEHSTCYHAFKTTALCDLNDHQGSEKQSRISSSKIEEGKEVISQKLAILNSVDIEEFGRTISNITAALTAELNHSLKLFKEMEVKLDQDLKAIRESIQFAEEVLRSSRIGHENKLKLRHESSKQKPISMLNKRRCRVERRDGELEDPCFEYMLESFTETRSTAEATEACASTSSSHHYGSHSHSSHNTSSTPTTTTLNDNTFVSVKALGLDQPLQQQTGSSSQSLPNPWDFDIQPDQEFADQTKVLEMPSSNRMSTCHVCNGDGVSHCFHCRGFGTDKCQYCRGTGMKAGVAHPAVYTHPMVGSFPHTDPSRGYPGSGSLIMRPPGGGNLKDKPYAVGTPVHFMVKAGLPPPGIGQHDLCIFCQGRGISDCHHCKGQGKKSCPTCGGQGNVRVFTKLKVFFSVECSDYYTPSDIPEILLRGATGSVSFAESQNYVLPLKKHPIKEINETSRKFCAAHLKKAMGSCRLLKQRHCVEAISIAKIKFKLGNKNGYFYVYGKQRLCYIPKNPSKCSVM